MIPLGLVLPAGILHCVSNHGRSRCFLRVGGRAMLVGVPSETLAPLGDDSNWSIPVHRMRIARCPVLMNTWRNYHWTSMNDGRGLLRLHP
jgi:hypothetical protein